MARIGTGNGISHFCTFPCFTVSLYVSCSCPWSHSYSKHQCENVCQILVLVPFPVLAPFRFCLNEPLSVEPLWAECIIQSECTDHMHTWPLFIQLDAISMTSGDYSFADCFSHMTKILYTFFCSQNQLTFLYQTVLQLDHGKA